MEILTGEQMRRVDRRTIEEMGIPGLQLMESAGRGVADALLEDFPSAASVGVMILCGKGNNGGDGLVAARYLARSGVVPLVLLLAGGSELKGDAATNLQRAREAGLDVREVPDEAAWSRVAASLVGSRVLLDALLGTGVRGGARGLTATAIEAMNQSGASICSVDLPSGIDADSPAVSGVAVRATRTYTLCRPKIALLLEPAAAHAGELRIIPIGIPDEAVRAEQPELDWLDATSAGALLPRRQRASHKGSYGHLLAVAGSRGKSGAAVLLARGALRCGVGLVTVAVPASTQDRVAVQQAEMMTEGLAETAAGSLGAAAPEQVRALQAQRTALALGPGLGGEPETVDAVRAIVGGAALPLVLDADALNALSTAGVAPLPQAGPDASWVLTPHPGEAARLLGCTAAEIQADRLGSARRLARETAAVVLLKGDRTLIASPDGRVSINSSGNPGMATGGTGDVLTGAVGAFLARGLAPREAARLAAFVHGDAGDRAASRLGVEGLIASDVVQELPAALNRLSGPEAP
jgi:NAD(P)H-hydrate epimerase